MSKPKTHSYVWDSPIGVFAIDRENETEWVLSLDDEHVLTSGSPESIIEMLRDDSLTTNLPDEPTTDMIERLKQIQHVPLLAYWGKCQTLSW